VAILLAVQLGDDRDSLLDNNGLADACHLSRSSTSRHALPRPRSASSCGARRGNQQPGPWYPDLELTVQGRRLLATQRATP
jgi:hypothetical protein